MEYKKIGFVGLGLIGGSIAKAVRRYYPDCEIAAFDKNRETLALAVQEGTIHTACSSIDDNFRGCSYIFLCTPVAYNAAYLAQLKDLAGKDCILTDVGSVKTSIHEEVIALDLEENFIGGHPMAAGFSIKEQNIDLLRQRLNELSVLTEEQLQPKLVIDVPMPVDYLYPELIRQLDLLEPFGKGNGKPVFADRNLSICSLRLLGREGRVVRMQLKSPQGKVMDAVYFGEADALKDVIREKYGEAAAEDVISGRCSRQVALNFSYYPEIDTYYQEPRIQLKITGFC